MSRTLYLVLLVISVAAALIVYQILTSQPLFTLRILDVGKGSAILVESPEGKTMLIDTGPDASIVRDLGETLPFWTRKIDVVLLTDNSHADAGGMPELQERYQIGTLVRSGTRGQQFLFDKNVLVEILWPPSTPVAMTGADSALTLKITYGATSFLIQSNLPAVASSTLAALDSQMALPTMTISSSTPAGEYQSDGKTVMKIK